MKFNQIGDGIVHITFKDEKVLASSMMRFQESYESPFPEIRGKVFTVGFLKSLGSKSNKGINTYAGGKTYDADWCGFNFPSHVLEPFIKGLFDPLTDEEFDVVEALKYRKGKYYIIATTEGEDPRTVLEHEIRHAMYYLYEDYKNEVDGVLKKYKKQLVNLRKCLLDWGYCEEVLDDECHAYMGSDYEWFFSKDNEKKTEKYNIKVDKELSNKLNKLAEKYKDRYKLNE